MSHINEKKNRMKYELFKILNAQGNSLFMSFDFNLTH